MSLLFQDLPPLCDKSVEDWKDVPADKLQERRRDQWERRLTNFLVAMIRRLHHRSVRKGWLKGMMAGVKLFLPAFFFGHRCNYTQMDLRFLTSFPTWERWTRAVYMFAPTLPTQDQADRCMPLDWFNENANREFKVPVASLLRVLARS